MERYKAMVCKSIIECTDEERVIIFYDRLIHRMDVSLMKEMFGKWIADHSDKMDVMMTKLFDLRACLRLRCYRNILKSKSPYKNDWIIVVHPFTDDRICIAINGIDYRIEQCVQMFIKRNLFLSNNKDLSGSSAEYSCFALDNLLSLLIDRFRIASRIIFYQYVILYKFLTSNIPLDTIVDNTKEETNFKNHPLMTHIRQFTESCVIPSLKGILLKYDSNNNNNSGTTTSAITQYDLKNISILLSKLNDISESFYDYDRNEYYIERGTTFEEKEEEIIKECLNNIYEAFINSSNKLLYYNTTEKVFQSYKYND
jgi:hypothetical protein